MRRRSSARETGKTLRTRPREVSDRTSAEIFRRIFEGLAKGEGPVNRKKLARELWKDTEQYDFHPKQLECDDVLQKLGLARRLPGQFGDECEYLGLDYEVRQSAVPTERKQQ